MKSANGVNVITPVDVFTEYTPSSATVSDVSVQFGGVCKAAHNLTEEATRDSAESFVSFARTLTASGVFHVPVGLSLVATGAHGAAIVAATCAAPHDAGGAIGSHVPPITLHT